MEIFLHFTLTTVIAILIIVLLYTLRLIRTDLEALLKELKSMRPNIQFNNNMREYSEKEVKLTQQTYEMAMQATRDYKDPKTKKVIEKPAFGNKSDCERVVEALRNLISQFNIAMLDDYYDLVGIPSTFEDSKWAWDDLSDVKIGSSELGVWYIDLPPLKSLSELQIMHTKNNQPPTT